jgi:hemin uptake protein HemP
MEDKLKTSAGKRAASEMSSATAGKRLHIESDHLFQGNSEIVIVHQTEEYTLRITRNGKLLLTK